MRRYRRDHRDVACSRSGNRLKGKRGHDFLDARPEWYFFFLFELLRIIRTPSIVQLATIGIPTLAIALLLLLPFYDRGPERRPERRPIATLAGIIVIFAMGYLTYRGAHAGTPDALEVSTPAAVRPDGSAAVRRWNEGRVAIAQSGCEACHTIGDNGNPGPGPNLTHVGSRVPRLGIAKRSSTRPSPCRLSRACHPRSSTRLWNSSPR